MIPASRPTANMTFRIVALATLLNWLVAMPSAEGSFHIMQIEQIIGGVNGDTTAQAIQLRLGAAGQNLVSTSRVSAVDATGANQIVLQNMTTNLPSPGLAGSRILLATPNFSNYTDIPVVADFVLTPIPVTYLPAGQVRFTSNNGSIIYWSVSWGGASFTGSTTGNIQNDVDGDFGPPVDMALPSTSLQALLFDGAATDKSTTNLADYVLTAGAATFTNYAGTSFTLVDPEPESADFDEDGDVDGADFLAWQRGESPDPLSAADLALWQEQFGEEPPLSSVVAVPEPMTMGLLACGVAALAPRKRRQQ